MGWEYLMLCLQLLGFLAIGGTLEVGSRHVIASIQRRWRLRKITSARHCLTGHAWGERYGPVNDGFINASYYWAWECQQCQKIKTEEMPRKELEAFKFITKIKESGYATSK